MVKPEQLKDKAINIKGKKYVLVSDRVIYFNENYINGSITSELISMPESDQVIIKATVYPDVGQPQRYFTGYSQAVKGDGMVNKTAALENAETSAIGRALAMMGIGVLDSIASADELNKAQSSTRTQTYKLATPNQIRWIRDTVQMQTGLSDNSQIDKWILSNLTIAVEKIPSLKVKDAVDKIRSLGSQQATEAEMEEIIIDQEETLAETAKRVWDKKDKEEDQELLETLRSEDE